MSMKKNERSFKQKQRPGEDEIGSAEDEVEIEIEGNFEDSPDRTKSAANFLAINNSQLNIEKSPIDSMQSDTSYTMKQQRTQTEVVARKTRQLDDE